MAVAKTYRFSGPQPGYKSGRNKGIMRMLRQIKREEAEERNKNYQKAQAQLIETSEPVLVS